MNNSIEGKSQERRLTAKGKETRARIVASAANLMFERGVAGTSVEDVQRAAKVSASQLYHYFKEKKELVLAVIAQQTETVLGAQQPLLNKLDSFEALEAWRNFIVEFQILRNCQGGCPIGSLASELAEKEPEARAELAFGFSRWEIGIRNGLSAMHARGELRADTDPESLALAVLAALQGGLLLTQIRREPSPIITALDTMLTHIRSLAV